MFDTCLTLPFKIVPLPIANREVMTHVIMALFLPSDILCFLMGVILSYLVRRYSVRCWCVVQCTVSLLTLSRTPGSLAVPPRGVALCRWAKSIEQSR